MSLRALFSPRSVAIVGDSPKPSRGGAAHEQLRARGFSGAVYPVNPGYAEVRGEPCAPDLASLPVVPDLVLVATPAPVALDVVEQCAALGVPAATVFGSGFADAGAEGAALQERLRDAAVAGGIALCGPNCYGVANLFDGVAATSVPVPGEVGAGGLALVLQSGALSHGVLDFAVRRRAGIGYVVTAGNEAVLDVADYLAELAADTRVRSVAAYVEAIRRPRAFLESLERLVGSGVAVTVLKSGRSAVGRRATQAHTGAVGDDARVWSAMLRSAGVVQVDDLGALAEAALFALDRPFGAGGRPSGDGDRPFLMSFSGAAASVLADLADDVALELRQPGADLASSLRGILPAGAAVANPLDLTGFLADRPEQVGDVVRSIDSAGERYLPVMVLNSPAAAAPADRALYVETVAALAGASAVPGTPPAAMPADPTVHAARRAGGARRPRAVGTMLPGDVDPDVLAACRGCRYPVVAGMRTLAAVLAARAEAERGRAAWTRARRAAGADAALSAFTRTWLAEVAPSRATAASSPPVVGEGRAKELLARAGLTTPRRLEVRAAADAAAAAEKIGFPVALKVDDPEIPHKVRAGCVALGLHDRDAVAAAAGTVLDRAARIVGSRAVRAIAVEEQVVDGTDAFVGVLRTEGLDPVLVAGLGGTAAEEGIGAIAMRLPVDRDACEAVLGGSALGALAASVGERPADGVAALADVLLRVSWVAEALGPALRALDVNPVRLVAAGTDGAPPVHAVVLDALVELAGAGPTRCGVELHHECEHSA